VPHQRLSTAYCVLRGREGLGDAPCDQVGIPHKPEPLLAGHLRHGRPGRGGPRPLGPTPTPPKQIEVSPNLLDHLVLHKYITEVTATATKQIKVSNTRSTIIFLSPQPLDSWCYIHTSPRSLPPPPPHQDLVTHLVPHTFVAHRYRWLASYQAVLHTCMRAGQVLWFFAANDAHQMTWCCIQRACITSGEGQLPR
jgi:hypothetical protein